MHPHLVICQKFLYTLFTLCRCLSCAQRSSRSILCKRRNKASLDRTVTDNSPIMKHRKALRERHSKTRMHTCPADTVCFAPFAKATNMFVAGSTQAVLWVRFYYHHYHFITILKFLTYLHLTYFTSPFVNILHTVCIGNHHK